MSDYSYIGYQMTEDRTAETNRHADQGEALAHSLDRSTADRLAQTFKALSDPTRVQIVSLLAGTELCVYDLAATLGMSQSAVSHQLRTLRDWRLVRRRREGRQIFYALDDEHVIDLFRRGLDHVTHE